jgi:CYTH domain-containing protein
MGIDKVSFVFVAAVCVVLLIRLMLGERRRARFDLAANRVWLTLQRRASRLWHWRRQRQSAEQAKQAAQDVINRVRHKVDKEGNVYKPDAFHKGPRKPH